MDRKDSPYSHWLRKLHLGFVVALLAKGYSHCINFILSTFFLKVNCTPHHKIAKELKEQNDGIYRTMMVSTYTITEHFPSMLFSPNQFELTVFTCIVHLLVGKLPIQITCVPLPIAGMRDYMLSIT